MTKKELSINIKWDEFEMGTCRLFVEVLDKYIPALFFQDHKPKPTVTDKMMKAVNDILDMDISEFDRLSEILGVKNYKIKEIHIDQDNDVFEGVYSEVIVSVSSNFQATVIIKDGKFICLNDGNYFETCVVDKKKNKKKSITQRDREKIIAMMSLD